MRFRTLEIRWHDSKPISSCDFQPVPSFKKARPANGEGYDDRWPSQTYRLATAGEDNHVRVWMVYPNLHPTQPHTGETGAPANTSTSRPPRVEYLATLSKHSAAVNVVRWSPNGELIASAGDDGMVVIWSPSSSPQVSTYGSDLTQEELQNEKEFWRVRCMFRCTSMQVYDLAWSPTGEYLITGSTDNVARVFQTVDGKCVHEIAEHNHFVQGVSWDPMNEYIATQSSDRSMHVYNISTPNSAGNKSGAFEAHAIGRNSNININIGASGSVRSRRHARTPSVISEARASSTTRGRTATRPDMSRRESVVSDVESTVSEVGSKDDFSFPAGPSSQKDTAPLTPATSVASTPAFNATAANSMFPPPPVDKDKQPSSRRSSFSGSNAPSSPAFSMSSRYARSPSPMPALPAIRTAPRHEERWKQIGLYGDESYTNFFRRLTFSPDGGLLITPAGQFEDPEIIPKSEEGQRGRQSRPSISTDASAAAADNNSCVYIYTRANFARPPVAQLPGFNKASVAVKFNPVLFQLRQGVAGNPSPDTNGPKTASIGKGADGSLDVDLLAPPASAVPHSSAAATPTSPSKPHIVAPAPVQGSMLMNESGLLSPSSNMRPPTPAASKPSTPMPAPSQNALTTGSVFALPYRMLFAVETMDTVAIYDTQQAGPFCMLTKLHYDEFTDLSWSPDGQCLLLSSRDGYCTLVIFDEIMPAYHTQQQTLQLQSIAHHHSMPLTYGTTASPHAGYHRSSDITPAGTPVFSTSPLPPSGYAIPTSAGRRSASDNNMTSSQEASNVMPNPVVAAEKRPRVEPEPAPETESNAAQEPERPKKKRRVALTKVSEIDS